jgi:hypothetical protein
MVAKKNQLRGLAKTKTFLILHSDVHIKNAKMKVFLIARHDPTESHRWIRLSDQIGDGRVISAEPESQWTAQLKSLDVTSFL